MDAVQQAEARSNLYGLLARFFRAELDAAMLAELRRPAVSAALRAAGVDVAALLPAGDDANLLADLAREYCRLFLLTFSPHESVQRGEGQLWGEYTVQVQDAILDLGLALPEGQSLLPDHLATELEVMQHLTEAEAGLLAAGGEAAALPARARQEQFLNDHLLKWAPAYLGTIERNAVQPFYAKLAALAASFLLSGG